MDRLLVALDVAGPWTRRGRSPTGCAAASAGSRLAASCSPSVGPSFVEELVGRGDRVFLDLKFHDIPNTVAGAVAAATRMGVWMMTSTRRGGADMMRRPGRRQTRKR